MRESILLSKMLLSAESWYTPFEYQIEKLEEVDLTFYRKLLNYHSKTGLEFLFGDSGTIPIKINSKMQKITIKYLVKCKQKHRSEVQ